MNTFKYGHIAEYCAAKEREREGRRKRTGAFDVAILVFSMVTWVMAGGVWRKHSEKKPDKIAIEGPPTSNRGNEAVWQSWRQAASLASKRWEATGITVPTINLVADENACGPKAIACASSSGRTIFVSKEREDVDRTTLMMHEIGHILGVPHIEGDPLMDAAYQGIPLDAPTATAVAIARVRQNSLPSRSSP